ncbi:MAG: hypothetical protein LBI55_00540 [Oscillospiraceae bacterium]|jgi:probable H4MPT-linked C1 transfer pathway protein|nr:hypothetical protein [Oscillospiraceae bacterium]
MNFLALDIGGAYTKSAFVGSGKNSVKILNTKRHAFNFRNNANNLEHALIDELCSHIKDNKKIDIIIITITAETVGIFNSIDDGVTKIASICEKAFSEFKICYVSTDGAIYDYKKLKANTIDFASANWVATSELASNYIENGLFIDMGSTTTDIIPIKNRAICPTATTDMTRLISGELLYLGLLRTYISNIVNGLPFRDTFIPLAAELRCFTAHVYVALGFIDELEMLHPFSGNKIKITKANSVDAIARSVCADTTLLNYDEIIKMGDYIYKEQMRKIIISCNKIINHHWFYGADLRVIITGSGSKIIENAVRFNKIGKIIDSSNIFRDSENATAVALSMMVNKHLKG